MSIQTESTDSIFLYNMPLNDMKGLTDLQILEQLKTFYAKNGNLNILYGDENNSYNVLHACALHAKIECCIWLLGKNLDPNLASGNGNTAFTFLLDTINDEGFGVEKFLDFAKKLKEFGGDLSLPGYENKSPLEIYARFNNVLHDKVIDLLIENSNFENNFLLSTVFMEYKYFNFRVLKKILSLHTIDLKKFIEPNKGSVISKSYWNDIALYLQGAQAKEQFAMVEWLDKKLGFELDNIHTINDYYGRGDNSYKVNLLGLAIKNKNKVMFQWVMKKRPQFTQDKFILNNKEYSLLEFSLICDFRHGAQLALRNMNEKEILLLEAGNLRELCKKYQRTAETFDKTYTSILYKTISEKYKPKNNSTKKLKI